MSYYVDHDEDELVEALETTEKLAYDLLTALRYTGAESGCLEHLKSYSLGEMNELKDRMELNNE